MLGLTNGLVKLAFFVLIGLFLWSLIHSPPATLAFLFLVLGAYALAKLIVAIFPKTQGWAELIKCRLVVIRELFSVGLLAGVGAYFLLVLLGGFSQVSTWVNVLQLFQSPPISHPGPFLVALVLVAIPTLTGLVMGKITPYEGGFRLTTHSNVARWIAEKSRFKFDVDHHQAPVRGRGLTGYDRVVRQTQPKPSLWVKFKWECFLLRKAIFPWFGGNKAAPNAATPKQPPPTAKPKKSEPVETSRSDTIAGWILVGLLWLVFLFVAPVPALFVAVGGVLFWRYRKARSKKIEAQTSPTKVGKSFRLWPTEPQEETHPVESPQAAAEARTPSPKPPRNPLLDSNPESEPRKATPPPQPPLPKPAPKKAPVPYSGDTDALKIYWAFLELPFKEATGHFLVTGTPGSGKTIQMRLLMQSVFKLMGQGMDQRALIYDGKREYIPVVNGLHVSVPVHILNPFDKRSVPWDIAADITTPAAAQQAATILVPQEQSSQPFFDNAARQLLYGVLYVLLKKAPRKWTLRHVLLIFRNKERLFNVLGLTVETREIRDLYFGESKTLMNVLTTVSTKLAPYAIVAALWDHSSAPAISLKTWLDEESILILGNNPAHSESIQPINQVMFRRLSDLLLSQKDSTSRRAWLFLDELREAGKMDGLGSLLNQGRSKGVCAVLGFQDIDGMRAVYGDNITMEITGQCRNKSFLRTDSVGTAKWAEEHFGYALVNEQSVTQGSNTSFGSGSTSQGSSYSTSTQHQLRHVVMATELMGFLPPSPATGFRGVHDVPSVGTFPTHISWKWIFDNLAPVTGETQEDRPDSDQELRPWSADDEEHLGLGEMGGELASGNPLLAGN